MKKLLASMAMFLTAATSVYAANSPEAIVPPVSGSAAEAGAPINPAGISTSRDAVQMVLELKDKYLRKHNLREGCFKGKCLVAATEIIEQPVGHSDYERYRQIAFKKAEARALAELVREAAVSVSTSMEQSLYEDWSSNAAKFPESGKGRSAAVSFLEKVRALSAAKLDALLRENGVDPTAFDAFPDDRKKELAHHTLVTKIAQKALRTLSGVTVLASFSTEDEAGFGAVCVVMGTSPELEAVAESFRSGRRPAIAPGASKLEDVIPQEPDALYAAYGVRVLNTGEGPVLVSYGMASCPYSGGDTTARYRKKGMAERIAEAQAVAQAARFLSQSVCLNEESILSEAVRETLTQSGRDMSLSATTEKLLTDIFKGRFETRASELLSGLSTWKRWSLVRGGNEIVGVVKVLEMPFDQPGRQKERLPERGKASTFRAEGEAPQAHVPAVHSGVDVRPDLF